jgi:hypothetical protein
MKKILPISIGIVCVAVAAFFLFQKNITPQIPQENIPGSVSQPTIGEAARSVPQGYTFTIATAKGGVAVKNFYLNNPAIIEESTAVVFSTDVYEIDYQIADSSFSLVLRKGPVAQVQSDAERSFLSVLGISREDACKLSVSVIISLAADATGGRTSGLSFCGILVQ